MLNSKLHRLPRNVWLLGIVSLLTDTSAKMIQSLLPLFLVSTLGANLATVGLIEGLAEATASILKVASGGLSDYWGQRKALAIAGYGLSTLVAPLFALATNPIWILIARVGDRVGKGIRVAPRNALVADATPEKQRGAAYGLRQSLDTIGAFTGPLIAAALMAGSGQNFRLVFWLAVIPACLAVGLLAIAVQETPTTIQERPKPLQWQALKQLGKPYWMLVSMAFLFHLGNTSDAFLLLRAQQVGVAIPLIPILFVVMNVAYFCSAYPVGVLSDRLGRLGLLVGGFLLFALVYLGFAFVHAPWQIWGLFTCYGLYLGMSQGVFLAFVADQVPVSLRGTAFGLIHLVTGISLLPANLLAGVLWQQVSPQAPFVVGSVCAIAAAILLLLTDRKIHPTPEAP